MRWSKERAMLDARERRARLTPRQAKHYAIWYKYGITIDEWEAMLAEQHDACKLCLTPFAEVHGRKSPMVDHDHATGKVRGLLCNSYNTKLGWYENRKDAILRYLVDIK